ncbi:MAG: response regulator transcription factor [Chloroflexi bacterium]|nr:response regulator transcription factor [Chloroflexota bacterium]
MDRIRVLLVEQYPLLADITCEILLKDPCIAVVGEAKGIEEATRLAARRRPDVALIDISAGESKGLALARELARTRPGMSVILLGEEASNDYAEAAQQAGASYLPRPQVVADLLPTLHRQRPDCCSDLTELVTPFKGRVGL